MTTDTETPIQRAAIPILAYMAHCEVEHAINPAKWGWAQSFFASSHAEEHFRGAPATCNRCVADEAIALARAWSSWSSVPGDWVISEPLGWYPLPVIAENAGG